MKTDPSRTSLIRTAFERDVFSRFDDLIGIVRKAVVKENLLGLVSNMMFESDPDKVKRFDRWLKKQITEQVLELDLDGQPWTDKYIERGYSHGISGVYVKLKKGSDGIQDFKPQAVSLERLRMLQTRTFEDLAGVTKVMRTQISRVLVDGMLNGDDVNTIAASLESRVKAIGKNRAKMIAHNEIVRANAEGSLDAIQAMGLDAAIAIEWSASGKPCPVCTKWMNQILKVEDARGLFPFHVYCRCSPVPVMKKATVTKSLLRKILQSRP